MFFNCLVIVYWFFTEMSLEYKCVEIETVIQKIYPFCPFNVVIV